MKKVLTLAAVAVLAVPMAALAANSLSVNGASALEGSFGLQVIADGTASDAYVSSEHPTDESTYTMTFWIDPANYPLAEATFVRIGRAIEVGAGQHLIVFLQKNNGNFRLLTWVRRDDGIFAFGTGIFLTSGATPTPTQVEVSWVQAAPGGNDGGVTMTNLTGGQTNSRLDLDNDTWEVDTFHWGLFTSAGNPNPGTVGSFKLDSFASFR